FAVCIRIGVAEVVDFLEQAEALGVTVGAGAALLLGLELAEADDRPGPVHRALEEDQAVDSESFERRETAAAGVVFSNWLLRIGLFAELAVFELVGEDLRMMLLLR